MERVMEGMKMTRIKRLIANGANYNSDPGKWRRDRKRRQEEENDKLFDAHSANLF
jgi:hypothetical protein